MKILFMGGRAFIPCLFNLRTSISCMRLSWPPTNDNCYEYGLQGTWKESRLASVIHTFCGMLILASIAEIFTLPNFVAMSINT